MDHTVRYGILGLVAVLAAGLAVLGYRGYQADRRALEAARQVTLALPAAEPPGGPAAAGLSAQEKPVPVAPMPQVVVHVSGAVAKPGIYRLEQGARVADAVEAAGGALPRGMPDALNLAARISDGDKIYVPDQESGTAPVAAAGATVTPVRSQSSSADTVDPCRNGKVNVNTASAEELDRAKWITPTMAKAIVEYRGTRGAFASIDELEKVKGIATKTLGKIRDCLSV